MYTRTLLWVKNCYLMSCFQQYFELNALLQMRTFNSESVRIMPNTMHNGRAGRAWMLSCLSQQKTRTLLTVGSQGPLTSLGRQNAKIPNRLMKFSQHTVGKETRHTTGLTHSTKLTHVTRVLHILSCVLWLLEMRKWAPEFFQGE